MLRKFMLAGLMATTLMGGITPAMAQRGDGREGRGNQANERRGDFGGGMRQGRMERQMQQRPQAMPPRQQAQQRPQRAMTAQPAVRPDNRGSEGNWRGRTQADAGVQRQDWRQRSGDDGRPAMRPDQRPAGGGVRAEARSDWQASRAQGRPDYQQGRPDWRTAQRDDRRDDRRGDWRDDRRDDRRDGRWNGRDNDRRDDNWRRSQGWNQPAWNNGRRFDDRTRWSNQRRWDNGWRSDRRYDWRDYRARYGNQFRVGRYYAPRGWNYGYRQVSVGFFLSSMLFANNYWLDDPWSYRLPPAYGSMRWVRYYDDALLVDIRDGYVVDVIRDFFW